jgi:hypothetical protein
MYPVCTRCSWQAAIVPTELPRGNLEAGKPNASRRPIIMFAIIVLAVAALVALMVFGFAIHVLFSPWLLLAAIAIVAWIRFRPSRSRR